MIKELFDKYSKKEVIDLNQRIDKVKQFKKEIKNNLDEISYAIYKDLGKSSEESYMSEIGLVLSSITNSLKMIKKYMKPKKVSTPLSQFISKSYILKEAYGNVLIISPWNYPFLLSIDPLINAYLTGNKVTLKPSEFSPNTNKIIIELIGKVFYDILVVEGGKNVVDELMELDYNYIFFTGSTTVGKIIYEKAASKMIPVTLELGGKSPCIVDKTNFPLAAKRIVFSKFLNMGQTCVAPDYILVKEEYKEELIKYLKLEIQSQYSRYNRVINKKHYDRLKNLITNVIYGGNCNDNELKIEPTILEPTINDNVMKEEIFGPLLPILTYQTLEDIKSIINLNPNPLSLYVYSNDKKFINDINTIKYGGGCINDCVIHLSNNNLPFGGVGSSGVGSYHGKYSLDTFTREKSILHKSNLIDLPFRYRPYTIFKDKMIKLFLK